MGNQIWIVNLLANGYVDFSRHQQIVIASLQFCQII
jgi:hypothetical protein